MTRTNQRTDPPASARRLPRLALICAGSAVALAISACGSSHGTTGSHPKKTNLAVTSSATTTAVPAPAPPVTELRIISPRPGAYTASTLTVHVALGGGGAAGARVLRYVLDGRLTRLGSARLTFRGLVPGQHHLLVTLLARPSVQAQLRFVVSPPPPEPSPAPATAPSAAQPSTGAAAPAPTPPPTTTTTHAAPAPTAPAPSSGIPQGANAGDADRDNHGGPTDGDGNI